MFNPLRQHHCLSYPAAASSFAPNAAAISFGQRNTSEVRSAPPQPTEITARMMVAACRPWLSLSNHVTGSFRNGSQAEIVSVALKMKNRSLGRLREFPWHTGERNRVWVVAPTVLTSSHAA